ncbi:hypothetical protein [Streptomyces johnsoniae]|uniref:Uncharacterized protein n=1 Tax=Streptomyces johnsoniae TaxID=3075532 RepID=A0ABU2S4B0_9ACTN|nr:hypothetical protein [Streptomyces sp. DSM 41886]MDT0443521.1 hypothetical protein [Streptomyces sp. DSM 41886]
MTDPAADEDGVLVHQQGFRGEPGQVVRISADGQRLEPLFRTEQNAYVTADSFRSFHGVQLVLSPRDYSLEEDIAAYGPEGGTPADASESSGSADSPDAEDSA